MFIVGRGLYLANEQMQQQPENRMSSVLTIVCTKRTVGIKLKYAVDSL